MRCGGAGHLRQHAQALLQILLRRVAAQRPGRLRVDACVAPVKPGETPNRCTQSRSTSVRHPQLALQRRNGSHRCQGTELAVAPAQYFLKSNLARLKSGWWRGIRQSDLDSEQGRRAAKLRESAGMCTPALSFAADGAPHRADGSAV